MSIFPHMHVPEHDQAPLASVVFGVSEPEDRVPVGVRQERPVLRVVDSQAASDFAAFAELTRGPIVVFVDEVAELLAKVEAQRAELHVDVTDQALAELAVRAVYPRRPLWRRLITRIGGAR